MSSGIGVNENATGQAEKSSVIGRRSRGNSPCRLPYGYNRKTGKIKLCCVCGFSHTHANRKIHYPGYENFNPQKPRLISQSTE